MKKNAFLIAAVFLLLLHIADAAVEFGAENVDLPAGLFFLYSLWVAIRNVVGYTLLAVAPIFLFGKASRWFLIPAYIAFLVIEILVLYVRQVFNANLSEIWLELLQNTSSSEIAGFLLMTLSMKVCLAMALVIFISGWFAHLMFTAQYPKRGRKSAITGILCCIPFLLFNCLLMNWHAGISQMQYTKFPIVTYLSQKRMGGIRRACQNVVPPCPAVGRTGAPDVIIVIGESATSKDWHLYGYPRSTTPRMDALESDGSLVVLKDVVGSQPDTVMALSLLLTDVTLDDLASGHWTLAGAYSNACYRCVLISRQYSISDKSSTLFAIFNGCEKRISVENVFGGKTVFDYETIPLMEKELASPDERPNLVLVHLAGMHFPVQNANPPEDDYFSDAIEPGVLEGWNARMRDRINRYDNATRYEDKVLGRFIDVLAKRNKPTAFFFISDHGESPRSRTWRDFNDEDVYCVPAVIWFSKEYVDAYPEKVRAFRAAASRPIQSDELTHGLLELGEVSNEFTNDPKSNFLHKDFKGRSPRKINRGKALLKRDCGNDARNRPFR